MTALEKKKRQSSGGGDGKRKKTGHVQPRRQTSSATPAKRRAWTSGGKSERADHLLRGGAEKSQIDQQLDCFRHVAVEPMLPLSAEEEGVKRVARSAPSRGAKIKHRGS